MPSARASVSCLLPRAHPSQAHASLEMLASPAAAAAGGRQVTATRAPGVRGSIVEALPIPAAKSTAQQRVAAGMEAEASEGGRRPAGDALRRVGGIADVISWSDDAPWHTT